MRRSAFSSLSTRVPAPSRDDIERSDALRLAVDDDVDGVRPRTRLARGVNGQRDRSVQLDSGLRLETHARQFEYLRRRLAVGLHEMHGDVDQQILRRARSAANSEADGYSIADADTRRSDVHAI